MTGRRRPPEPVFVDFLYATDVAGWTVAIRGRRVWLHRTHDGDGDMTPKAARVLADTILAAADRASRDDQGDDRRRSR
jgi:hypothetical protein